MIDALIAVGLTVFTVLTAAFCIVYALRSNWRATAPGRALMYLNLTLAGMGANSLAGHLSDEYGAYEPLRAVLLLAGAAVLVRQLKVLWEAQEQQR